MRELSGRRLTLGAVPSTLLNPGIYLGALVTALLVFLAYQARPSYDIPFGTPTDRPLLRGFNAGEETTGANGFKYRWSTGDALVTLQDVGRQDFDVVLTVNGSRPQGQPAPSLIVSTGGRNLLQVDPPPQATDYHLQVPREVVRDSTLALRLQVNAFTAPNDPRELGIIVTRLRVSPSSNPDRLIEPPLGIIAAITGATGLLGLVLSLLGWGVGGTALGALLPGLLAAWLLVANRLWLTTHRWYDSWPGVLLAGAVLIFALYLVGGWLLRLAGSPWTVLQRRLLLTLMLLAFVVRLAGQLHPQITIVDLVFHSHRFETVQSGQLLFTTESAEWGGSTFYLPTPYIFMLPMQWLLNNELLVIKLFTVGLSTLGAFALFYIGKRALGDTRAGLIATTLYLTLPLAVLPFSWGITSNVFGEFFALCSFAILVTSYGSLRPNRPAFWALLFTLLMALLSHPGVVQLTIVSFGFISFLWLMSRRMIGDRRGAAWALAALLVGFGLSYIIYYNHFAADMIETFKQLQAERAARAKPGEIHLRVGGSIADRSLGLIVRTVSTRFEWFFGGLRGFWQEAQAYYRVWPVMGALLGYLYIRPKSQVQSPKLRVVSGRRALLVVAALGWILAVVLFALVGWTTNLYVRYSLFALPVVALGAGALLSGLWRKGRPGVLIVTLILVFFAVEALALWQYRITYAFK